MDGELNSLESSDREKGFEQLPRLVQSLYEIAAVVTNPSFQDQVRHACGWVIREMYLREYVCSEDKDDLLSLMKMDF